MSEKIDLGRREDVKPDTGERRLPMTISRSSALKLIATMSGIFVAGDTNTAINPETPPAIQKSVQKEKKEEPQQKPSSDSEAELEKQLARTKEVLGQALEYLDKEERLQSDIAIFKKNLDSQGACTFVDEWYKPNKDRLHTIWNYADQHTAEWDENLQSGFNQALSFSQSLGKNLNFFRSKEKKFPMTEEQMRAKIKEFLPKPPVPETSCTWGFSAAFGVLSIAGEVPELQRLIADIFKGIPKLLLKRMEGKKAIELQKELEVADEYFRALGAMMPEKK